MNKQSFLKTYAANEFVFCEGDHGDCAYLIERGHIAIQTKIQEQDVVVASFGPGEIFGEMAILDGLQRSASAMATEDTQLIVIPRQQLFDHLDKTDPVVKLLVTVLLKRMRQTNIRAFNSEIPPPSAETEQILKYEKSEPSDKEAVEHIRMESELKDALTRNEFHLVYQPIVHTSDHRIAGFEALIRWNSKVHGPVPPDRFMKIVEETSLIFPIGIWIQERAFKDFVLLKEHLKTPLFMSVNTSPRQLENTFFLKEIEVIRESVGIKPSEIKLEVTERMLLDGYLSLQMLKDAQEKGYQISIDDFGTGYSNLLYLVKFSFDSIKIDRSFIKALWKDPKISVLFLSLVNMARDLGFKVIAEGVETKEEVDKMKDFGVDYCQGYFFSRPQSVEYFLKLAP